MNNCSVIYLNIEGEPVTWHAFMKRHFTPEIKKRYEKLKAWQNSIAWQAKSQIPDDFTELWNCPLYLAYVTFRLTRPKSVKSKYPHKKPDLDNLIKAVWDALEGVVYINDSRIVLIGTTAKVWADGEEPGVSLEIRRME